MSNYNVLILGNSNVGKTTFFKTATGKGSEYNYLYYSTVGIDCELVKIPIKDNNNNNNNDDNNIVVKLQLWDTAGANLLRHISTSYIRTSNAILLFFDITQRYSYDSIKNYWLGQIVKHASSPVVIYLLGTHSDKLKQREISLTEIFEWTNTLKIPYYEISSYSGYNVGNVLIKLSKDMVNCDLKKCKKRMKRIKQWISKNETTKLLHKNNSSESSYMDYKCFFCF